MNKFETKVQYLKYQVLKEVARLSFEDALLENVTEIPRKINPGKIPTMRCCVYKEREILGQRVRLAVGGNRYNRKVVQVIDIACDDCPAGGYEVTSVCRGCLAHRCEQACRRGAISFGRDQKAYIDKSKCVECGLCSAACPYNAIVNHKRPCEVSCKVGAISMGKDKEACINYEKCTACGACSYTCPFGAITDRSYILDVVDLIKQSEAGKNYALYALIAPSIAGQFLPAELSQVVTGLRRLGFTSVEEVALGADLVAKSEARELAEKGFLLSSCCPAFVSYVGKNFPALTKHISHNLSPAGTLAKLIKAKDPGARIVFIGPCTAKKTEFQRKEYEGLLDSVITFEELQALFGSRDIEIETLPETPIDQASAFGRGLAVVGGLSEAVYQALRESGSDFDYKPISCNGIEECKAALLRADKGVLPYNFIEGMACQGGCIGGAGCIVHEQKGRQAADRHARNASAKSIEEALSASPFQKTKE